MLIAGPASGRPPLTSLEIEPMMGYGAGSGLGFGWTLGGTLTFLGCVLLVLGVVLVVAWLIGRLSSPAGASSAGASSAAGAPAGPTVSLNTASAHGADAAVSILRERFARGEISADDFTTARQALEATR